MSIAQRFRTFLETLFGNNRYIDHLEQEVEHLRKENAFLSARIDRMELNSSSVLAQQSRRPQTQLPDASVERPTNPATFAGNWSKYLQAHVQQQQEAEPKKAS